MINGMATAPREVIGHLVVLAAIAFERLGDIEGREPLDLLREALPRLG
jgi:hypothetical protein